MGLLSENFVRVAVAASLTGSKQAPLKGTDSIPARSPASHIIHAMARSKSHNGMKSYAFL